MKSGVNTTPVNYKDDGKTIRDMLCPALIYCSVRSRENRERLVQFHSKMCPMSAVT